MRNSYTWPAPSATQIIANPFFSIKCSRCASTPVLPSKLKGTFIFQKSLLQCIQLSNMVVH